MDSLEMFPLVVCVDVCCYLCVCTSVCACAHEAHTPGTRSPHPSSGAFILSVKITFSRCSSQSSSFRSEVNKPCLRVSVRYP